MNIKTIIKKTPLISSIRYIRDKIRPINISIARKRINKYFNKSKYPKQIRAIKDIHKGQRCFLIGNGPSLKIEDLDKLVNEYSFSTNMIYRAFDKTKWRPYYYIVSDASYVPNDYKNVLKVPSKNTFIGLENNYKPIKLYKNSDVIMYHKKTILLDGYIPVPNDNIDTFVNTGHTTLFEACEIAIYMGFSKIYLIGVDCNYGTVISKGKLVSSGQNHFYKGADNSISSMGDAENMRVAFQALEEFSEKKGVKIYNATRGGKLEVFERVDFNSLFSAEK